jgi:4'-phosphopantetheinyl transferase
MSVVGYRPASVTYSSEAWATERRMIPQSLFSLIPTDQIHVWSADLDFKNGSVRNYHSFLSTDERSRAEQFCSPIHRNRFITSRGILRILLGHYLHVDPHLLSLAYGSHGKPALSELAFHFNISHSEGHALFAFSSSSPLGVDIERLRPMPDAIHLATGFFSSTETQELRSIPAEHQAHAFLKCWTRKEALVKALGKGLSFPLDQFSMSLDEPARLLQAGHDQPDLLQWQIYHLEPEQNYLGAVATLQKNCRIVMRQFSEVTVEPELASIMLTTK